MTSLTLPIVTEDTKKVLYNISLIQYRTPSRIENGHSLFKYSIEDNYISKTDISSNSTIAIFKYEPGYIYVSALNIKGATKRIIKIINDANIGIEKIKKQMPLSSLRGGVELDNGNTKLIT